MKLKYCSWIGCNKLVQQGQSFCTFHQGKAEKEKHEIFKGTERKSSRPYNDLYHTARWRTERKTFLMEHPLCCICGEPATIVDHIRPHRGNEEIFWNQNNWQPMCQSCHSAKTLQENNYFKRDR